MFSGYHCRQQACSCHMHGPAHCTSPASHCSPSAHPTIHPDTSSDGYWCTDKRLPGIYSGYSVHTCAVPHYRSDPYCNTAASANCLPDKTSICCCHNYRHSLHNSWAFLHPHSLSQHKAPKMVNNAAISYCLSFFPPFMQQNKHAYYRYCF